MEINSFCYYWFNSKNKKKKKSTTSQKLRDEESGYNSPSGGNGSGNNSGGEGSSNEREKDKEFIKAMDAGKTDAQRRFEEVQKKRVSGLFLFSQIEIKAGQN